MIYSVKKQIKYKITMKKRNILGLAGLIAGTLLSVNCAIQHGTINQSHEKKVVENNMESIFRERFIGGLSFAIERAELTNYTNVWIRSINSNAFGPQQIKEILLDEYHRQGEISLDDYTILKPIYRRMDYKLKKRNPDLYIGYGKTAELTQEEKEAYQRVSRVMIHDTLERNNYDLEESLLDWRWGRNSKKTIAHDPRYFRVANMTLADYGIL